MQLPSWYSRRLVFAGIALLIIVIVCVLLIQLFFPKKETTSKKIDFSTAEIVSGRESARVYVKDLSQYKTISVANRSKIETTFYNYAYILGGTDLYTGVIRKNSYTINTSSGGDFNLEMLVDVDPVDVTYKISVIKNKTTDNREVFFITCAPKSEQKDKDAVCKDEEGNGR